MNNKCFKIMENIASVLEDMGMGMTTTAAMMGQQPNIVIGTVNPSYKKQKTGGEISAMRNYKFKKNGKLNRKEKINQLAESVNYEARKAVLDRKAQQIKQNTNELIGMNNEKKIVPKVELSEQPKNDAKFKEEARTKNKEESKKLLGQAANLYKNVRRHVAQGKTDDNFKDSVANLGQAIIDNYNLHNLKESCAVDIATMIMEMLFNE